MTWLVKHSGTLITYFRKDENGRTSYHKMKGRPFNGTFAQVGESVYYVKAGTAGKEKDKSRWDTGVWCGVAFDSGEYLVGTELGILKCRSYKRIADKAERFNVERIKNMKGTP